MGDSEKPEGEQSDTRPLPTWIDAAFIQRALPNNEEDNLQVADIDVSFATAPGDNYGSAIYRVKATLTNGSERSFVVKEPTGSADLSLLVKIFKKEAEMLSSVLPQMEALLEQAAPGRFPPLAPRCHHSGSEPVEFLVVDDLAPAGFVMADRTRGLGLRHCLLAVRTLARFHAASHALLRREPQLAERYHNCWREIYGGYQQLFDGAIQSAADACRSWPGVQECAARLEKFKPDALETFNKLNDAKPGAFNVITHGDFWANNMMFRYENGVPKEHRAVDLQLSRVASPAIDLVYFLSSSPSEDVHAHHQDLLLREYHFELTAALDLLGLEAPSLESLLSSVNAHGSYALYVAVLVVPIIKVEKATDVEALAEGNFSKWAALENPGVKRWLQRALADYARRGWLPA